MALSLGRMLYTLAAGRAPELQQARPARPAGDLLWLHAPHAAAVAGLLGLVARLRADLGVAVLLTCPDLGEAAAGVILQSPPLDRPAEVRAFLAHWQPRLALFAEGEVRPVALAEMAAQRLPALMVNARDAVLPKGRGGWYPGLMRASLASVASVFVVDEQAARSFHRAGALDVEFTGRMEEPSAALPHHEPERAALASLMATRPVWLAVDVPQAEEEVVIAAHRAALRLAHRLLLILVPQDFSRAAELTERFEQGEGWHVAQRGLEQEPEPETTVFIADSASEYGLWYRLAPISFMGGSVAGEGCARNPMEAAAMGSAIIYGPRAGIYGSVFGRLGAAQAARAVGGAEELGEALGDLLAPDRTAKLAQAAWGLSSDGVEATDRVFAEVRRILARGA
ncbi:MAG: glycosyltransferase N-terminal domain-containing protein [Cypionkella sp.]